jgi:MFS family permease
VIVEAYRAIPWSAWRVLMHSVLFGLGISFFDVLFTFYLVSMGFGSETAGILSTTARIAGLVIGLPAGVFVDRIGPRRALVIGVVGYAAMMAWLLFAPTVLWLIISQFAAGCFVSLAMTAMMPMITTATPPAQRPLVFGLNEASIGLGLIGSVIAGWLPSVLAPWVQVNAQDALAYRLALLVGVAIIFIAVVPILTVIQTSSAHDDAAEAHDSDVPIKAPRRIVGYAVASLFVGMGGGTFLPFQSLYFRTQLGMADHDVGIVIAIGEVLIGAGALLAGRWLGQRNLRHWAGLLRLITAPIFACLMIPVLPFALVGYFGRSFLMGGSFALNDVLTMHLVNARQRGRVASLMTVFWSAGWGISATLSGYVQTGYGFAPLIAFSAVAYVLSGLAIWFFTKD